MTIVLSVGETEICASAKTEPNKTNAIAAKMIRKSKGLESIEMLDEVIVLVTFPEIVAY